MKVTLSENIIEHAKSKNKDGILVELRISNCGCCCAGKNLAELEVLFLENSKIDKLSKSEYEEAEAEGLRVLVSKDFEVGEDVHIEMNKFLGRKFFSCSGLGYDRIACNTGERLVNS